MAEGEVKISALPSGSSLTGVEKIPMVQGGITIEASAQEIADLTASALALKQDRVNGVVSGCVISIGTYGGTGTDNDIRVTAGSWFISPTVYSKGSNTEMYDIELCSAGKLRYIDIVGKNDNTIVILDDTTESEIPVHNAVNIATEVLLGWVLIGDDVIEAPTGGGASIISDTEFVLNKTWSSSNISKNLHTYRHIEFIATEEQDINSPIIQGITATTGELALFTAQLIPSENGEYFYQSGAGWIKTAAWFDYRANEAYYNESLFLRNTAFYALKGTEVGSLYVMNVDEPSYAFSKIGGSLTQSSQAQVEAAFDNTNQTTPVVLEQTSALTPFNAWWLVQKIKTWAATDTLVVHLAGAETVTGLKTFSAGLKFAAGQGVYDANGNLIVDFSATTTAVNRVLFINAATGGTVAVTVSGTDTNIPIRFASKGAASLLLATNSTDRVEITSTGRLKLQAYASASTKVATVLPSGEIDAPYDVAASYGLRQYENLASPITTTAKSSLIKTSVGSKIIPTADINILGFAKKQFGSGSIVVGAVPGTFKFTLENNSTTLLDSTALAITTYCTVSTTVLFDWEYLVMTSVTGTSGKLRCYLKITFYNSLIPNIIYLAGESAAHTLAVDATIDVFVTLGTGSMNSIDTLLTNDITI